MGDMADFFLEQVMDFEDLRSQFHMGILNQRQAYDLGIIDELGYEPPIHTPIIKTCRCCNVSGLHWGEYKGKWRLFENGKLHECKVNPLNESGT